MREGQKSVLLLHDTCQTLKNMKYFLVHFSTENKWDVKIRGCNKEMKRLIFFTEKQDLFGTRLQFYRTQLFGQLVGFDSNFNEGILESCVKNYLQKFESMIIINKNRICLTNSTRLLGLIQYKYMKAQILLITTRWCSLPEILSNTFSLLLS